MSDEIVGYIYILTNPSFPAFVKIGYAKDVVARVSEFNSNTCVPYAFRIYATYAVETRLSDKKVHKIIDMLNPDLRTREDWNGSPRTREFFEMSAEDAYSILEAMAEIHGREDCLTLWEMSEEDRAAEESAQEATERQAKKVSQERFSFDKCNIDVGEEVAFVCAGNEHSGETCTVVDNTHVRYGDSNWSLSGLACKFTGKSSLAGPRYFQYNGRWLNDIRGELEGWGDGGTATVFDSWITPSSPSMYDIEAAFEELPFIEWGQSTYVQPGDTVYIYVSQPVMELRYKCVAIETDLYGPSAVDDSRFYLTDFEPSDRRHMRLKLVEKYDAGKYPWQELKKHGLTSVQGPRRVPADLEEYLNATASQEPA